MILAFDTFFLFPFLIGLIWICMIVTIIVKSVRKAKDTKSGIKITHETFHNSTNDLFDKINDFMNGAFEEKKEENKEPEYVKCEYCDSKVEKGSAFCPNCGAKMN